MTVAPEPQEPMLDRLACALALPRIADQRAALRTLAYEVLRDVTTDAEVARAFAASPLVGRGPTQLNPRPCLAGLRDMLKLVSAACLVHAWACSRERGREEAVSILRAIKDPVIHGVRGEGRTGFAFGRTPDHSDAAVAEIRADMAKRRASMSAARRSAAAPGSGRGWTRGAHGAPATAPAKPGIELAAMSAGELCAAIGAAAIRSGVDRANILAVLAGARDAKAREVVGEAAALGRRRSHHPIDLADVPKRTATGAQVEAALVELMSRRAAKTAAAVAKTGAKTSTATSATATSCAATGPSPSCATLPTTRLGPTEARVVDLVLGSAGMPPINDLLDGYRGALAKLSKAELDAAELREQLAVDAAEARTVDVADAKGAVVSRKASEVFEIDGPAAKTMFGFGVPAFEWEVAHPHVPPVDPDYVFRPMELFRLLMALVHNQRAYLHGHTGTGKTTLVEQVAARLRWPFLRLNFDSEITRLDLIGRDTLINEGGTTVSRFVEGILPQALSGPYILCFDELDFGPARHRLRHAARP